MRARVKACRVGGRCADFAPGLAAGGRAAFAPFDGPGEYGLRVALEDAAGNVGPFAPAVTLRFDDTPPGAPDVSAADRWQRGADLPLSAEGTPPVSGVRGYRVRIGGRDAIVATAIPLGDLPEGGTPVEVRSVSGAGVESTAVRTLLRMDRTAPVVVASGAPSADAWSREPVVVGLRARDQAALSGVDGVHWTIDGAEHGAAGDEAAVAVDADGRHAVTWWATDRAGNASARGSATIKVDRTPPETVAFEAPDPADPTRVSVVVVRRDLRRRRRPGRAAPRRARRRGRGCRPRSTAGGSSRGSTTRRCARAPTSSARSSRTPRATRRSAPPARTARRPRSRSRSAGRPRSRWSGAAGRCAAASRRAAGRLRAASCC